MPRRNPLRIVEHFVPDPSRCARALIRLLLWDPPQDRDKEAIAPAPMQGVPPREEPADQEPPP